MKLGCSGCVALIVVVALVSTLVGGAVGAGFRMLSRPDRVETSTTAADGSRAQRKLFELGRASKRGEAVTLTEAEVNALLSRHLVEARGVRLSTLHVKLVGGDRLVVHAESPLRQLLDEASAGAVADLLPASWQARLVWLHVGARLRIETDSRRQLRMDVDEFAVGRQRLPVPFLRVVLDPAAVGLMQWPLPEYVERVEIEPGRVVLRTAP